MSVNFISFVFFTTFTCFKCSSFILFPQERLRYNILSSVKTDILYELASEDKTQTKLTPDQISQYNKAIESLPNATSKIDVNGVWKLLATISPDSLNVDFFDINSWKNYISGSGPSPVQSLITGSSSVSGISQWLTSKRFDNIVEFKGPFFQGKLVLKADQEAIENNKRIFRFRRGIFILRFIWDSFITFPYPVPFQLLGDRAVGWLETTHFDSKSGFRVAVGNKGTRFIFLKELEEEPDEDVVIVSKYCEETTKHETNSEEKQYNENLSKSSVVLCPQQFGGKPGDYTVLIRQLRERGHPVYLVRLSALDWLSILKSAFTLDYFKGELEPSKALPFYMNAINDAIQRMPEDKEYTLLSHSIGGWVARAWLGEVASEKVRKRCKRFVSLGTPHVAPPENSLVAKIDQTRGLLKYVNDKWPGAYFSHIKYACIASNKISGGFKNLDSILGFASYFALSGEGNIQGDGITPVNAAILEGADSVILDEIYHADILPNPISSKNTKLLQCKWYADKIDDWEQVL